MVKAVDLKVSPTPIEFWGELGKCQCDVKNLKIIYDSKKLVLTGTEKPEKSDNKANKNAFFYDAIDIQKVVLIEDTACEKFVVHAQHHMSKNNALEFSIVINNQKYQLPVKALRDDFGKVILLVNA